jgi:hypothetical protein
MEFAEFCESLRAGGGRLAVHDDLSGLDSAWQDLFAEVPLIGSRSRVAVFEVTTPLPVFRARHDVVSTTVPVADGRILGRTDGGAIVVLDKRAFFVDFLDGRPLVYLMADQTTDFIEYLRIVTEHELGLIDWDEVASSVPGRFLDGWEYWNPTIEWRPEGFLGW